MKVSSLNPLTTSTVKEKGMTKLPFSVSLFSEPNLAKKFCAGQPKVPHT